MLGTIFFSAPRKPDGSTGDFNCGCCVDGPVQVSGGPLTPGYLLYIAEKLPRYTVYGEFLINHYKNPCERTNFSPKKCHVRLSKNETQPNPKVFSDEICCSGGVKLHIFSDLEVQSSGCKWLIAMVSTSPKDLRSTHRPKIPVTTRINTFLGLGI